MIQREIRITIVTGGRDKLNHIGTTLGIQIIKSTMIRKYRQTVELKNVSYDLGEIINDHKESK